MVDADRVEDLEFKWGKRRGVGGEKKEITVYQSFTYNGVEYVLYDCVYLFKEGEPEPYIGKLIKIWEKPDKTKKVKVLWFFRPCEIQNYLDVEDTAENELFLASGEGVGLANVNALEAIAGKCNVVCTSKDSRNPQPSDEELQAADYIFYRTFDVGCCKILDKIEEIVAGIEAKFIFNRLDLQKPGIVLTLDSDKKGVVGPAVASTETEVPYERNLSKEHTTQTTKKVSIDTVGKEHADSNASLAKEEFSFRDKPASIVGTIGEMALSNDKMDKISINKTKSGSEVKSAEECGKLEDRQPKKASNDKNENNVDLDGNDSKALATKTTSEDKSRLKFVNYSQGAEKQESSLREEAASVVGIEIGEIARSDDQLKKISSNQTKSEAKSAEEYGELEDRPSKKAKYDSFVKVSDDNNEKNVDLDGNDSKALATKTTSEDKSRLKFVNDSQGAEKQESSLREEAASVVGVEIGEMALSNGQLEKISSNQTESRSEVKSAEEYGELEDRPSKKAKYDSFVRVSDDKNEKNVDLDGNDSKALATKTTFEDKSRQKFMNDSQETEKGPCKKLPDKKTELLYGKLLKASPRQSPDLDKKMDHQVMEVICRPNTIRDAITAVNQKVNLVGVIIEFGVPRRTKGTDCVCTLKIVDESYPKPGLSVNIFAESMEKLPHVASTGDIIQFSNVVMKAHCGEVNAVFNKRFSSFALYGGKGGEDFLPYQVSEKFRPRDLDKKFIGGLRKWLADFQLDEGSTNFLFLREIKEGERVDLACKIVHICEVAKDEWMAYLWDGTDAPPIGLPTKLEDELKNPLPLQLEPMRVPRDLLCTFPTVGTILRVIFDRGVQKQYLNFLHSGKWVKFVNVLCEVQSGLWLGVLTSFTKLRYTPDDDHLILARQRLYNERLSSELGRIPYWCFPWTRITEVDYDRAPFVTLMDVLTYPEVTAKFKCVARVVAALPWQAEDLLSPLGTYRMRLTLEDPTARIHALLYGEDGEKFFDGHPSVDVLKQKLNKLLGLAVGDDGKEIKDAPRRPPWAQFCLKSYYLSKSEAWGSRQYRIFGTKLE